MDRSLYIVSKATKDDTLALKNEQIFGCSQKIYNFPVGIYSPSLRPDSARIPPDENRGHGGGAKPTIYGANLPKQAEKRHNLQVSAAKRRGIDFFVSIIYKRCFDADRGPISGRAPG